MPPPEPQPQQQQQQQQLSVDDRIAANEAEIAQRSEGIDNLGRSVQEVAALYQDMSLLVQTQGTQLDNIEMHLHQTVNDTTAGVRELERAEKHHKSYSRKSCMCAGCVCLIVIVLVIVLIPKH